MHSHTASSVRRALPVLVLAVLFSPMPAMAKTLYVNGQNGNDATTYAANGPSAPWRTIGRAAWGSTNRDARNGNEAARAGDVVIVAAGTYSAPGTNSRNVPAFHVHNSGSAGNPITFRANGTVNLTLSSGRGSTIGAYEQNYIVWDGFTIHEATAPSVSDTGAVTVFGCTGCQLLSLDINGNGSDNNRMDNHTGIRIERSREILIRNNRIQNVYNGSNTNNGAGIQVYGSGALTFEHNEIFNCGAGIFLKGGPNQLNDYFTIRYNLIYNIGRTLNAQGDTDGSGIVLHAGTPNSPARPVRIYQNVVRNAAKAAVRIWQFDNSDYTNNPLNSRIVNNTFHGNMYGVWVSSELLPNAGHIFRNNIISSATHVVAYNGMPNDKGRFDSEHNVGFSATVWGESNLGRQQLSAWQSSTGQDRAQQAASLVADPLYENAGGNDFRLRSNSPARSVGRDYLDLDGDGSTSDTVPAGAYITGSEVIGRTSSSSAPPPPSAGVPQPPSNIRILGS